MVHQRQPHHAIGLEGVMVLALQDLLSHSELVPGPVPKRLTLGGRIAERLPVGWHRGERDQRCHSDQAQSDPQLDSTRSTYRSCGGIPSAIARSSRARPMWYDMRPRLGSPKYWTSRFR